MKPLDRSIAGEGAKPMEEKLIPAILTVFGVLLLIWLIPQLVKVWRISHDKSLEPAEMHIIPRL